MKRSGGELFYPPSRYRHKTSSHFASLLCTRCQFPEVRVSQTLKVCFCMQEAATHINVCLLHTKADSLIQYFLLFFVTPCSCFSLTANHFRAMAGTSSFFDALLHLSGDALFENARKKLLDRMNDQELEGVINKSLQSVVHREERQNLVVWLLDHIAKLDKRGAGEEHEGDEDEDLDPVRRIGE